MEDFVLIGENLDQQRVLEAITTEFRKIKKTGTKVISLLAGEAAGSTTLATDLSKYLPSTEFIGTDDALIGDRAYRREHLEGKEPLLKYDVDFLREEVKKICSLEEGEEITIPVYEEGSGLAKDAPQEDYSRKIGRVDYLIVEGAVHFLEQEDYLIYMDVPDEARLVNRIERGLSIRREKSREEIIRSFKLRHGSEYNRHVKPIIDRSDMILKVKPIPNEGGFIYQYSIYLKKK